MHKKFIFAGIALGAIVAIGTIGYWLIGGREYSFLDSLYMTVITISTIGYGEIIRLSDNPVGRLFTIFIALSGIGILFYIITNLTAFVVEGELKDSFRRRKMEKIARNYKDHYIVCGIGIVGAHIIHELYATGRPYIIVDISRDNLEKHADAIPADVFIEDDATDDNTLLKAGIMKAKGLFAVTGDDNQNLVICLSAKQLKPRIRVVAECSEIKNSEKMRKAGADSVVSPSLIGGLRMASEMIRPTVVSFLDIMLRDKEKNLRIEEIPVPASFAGKSISALDLTKYSSLLLLAVRIKDDFIYNPSDDYVIQEDNTLIFMSPPEERKKLEKILNLHG
jgi:voltage-gated potassium channel